MRVQLGTMASVLVLAAIHSFAENQTQFHSSGGKTVRKREGKKEIPTFVGSDGVVRKVSPSAILDEMKRCLPPGIPIPMAAVWPELPPNLGEAPEENEVEDNQDGSMKEKMDCQDVAGSSAVGMANEHNLHDGRKRVMRSNGAVKSRSEDFGVSSSDDSNVKIEMPAKESVIFSPTEPNQKKFADVLKELFSKCERNSTGFDAKYIDEGAVADRFKTKFKPGHTEDYQDYEYEEQHKRARDRVNQRDKHRSRKSKHLGRRRGTTKGYDIPLKMLLKARRRHGKENQPVYDYDYDGAAEDGNIPEDSECRDHANRQADLGPQDELGRQIELNGYLGALTERLTDADDVGLAVDKRPQAVRCSARVGSIDEGNDYKKILATVMELNSSLVRLLDRAILTAMYQKRMKTEEPDEFRRSEDKTDTGNVEGSVTSFLLECMELLMQKRKGLREKRENSALVGSKDNDLCLTDTKNLPRQAESSKRSTSRHHSKSIQFDDLNLLKWLVKWYLAVTMSG